MKRNTKQRKAILEVLSDHKKHPTTEQLFEEVKAQVPGIGIATVYRNLEILQSKGLIRRIDTNGGAARYDGNSSPHHHAFCIECGKIMDVQQDFNLSPMLQKSEEISGFTLNEVRIEFSGYCGDCIRKKA